MDSTDTSRLVDAARTWIADQTGLSNTSLHIFQFEKKGSDYEIGVEGSFAGTTRKYLVTVNSSGDVIGHREAFAYETHPKSDASLLITLAFVFSILALIGFGIYFVILLAVAIAAVAIIALIPGVLFFISIYCFIRINKIRQLYNEGRYREALQENTVGLGILALIFNGVITGILLLIARSSMQ